MAKTKFEQRIILLIYVRAIVHIFHNIKIKVLMYQKIYIQIHFYLKICTNVPEANVRIYRGCNICVTTILISLALNYSYDFLNK